MEELISTIQSGWDDVPELRLTAAGIEARLERLLTAATENTPTTSSTCRVVMENRTNGLMHNNNSTFNSYGSTAEMIM